jgi:uncharacterized protein YndB with AHSA1/START domain
MSDRERYTPDPAVGAEIPKDGDNWTLVLIRELRHSPEKVWQALTDPAHLREWRPSTPTGAWPRLEPGSRSPQWEPPRRTSPKRG